MNTLLKRIISLVLCLVMVVGYVPVNAFADETGEAVSTEATEAPLVVADEESEPDTPDKPADPKGPGKEEKPGKPEKEEKPGKPEKEEKPGKPEHEKPGKPEAPKPEQETTPVTEETVPETTEATVPVTEETVPETTEETVPEETEPVMMMMAAPKAAAYQVPSPYAEQGYSAVDAAVIFTDLHTMKGGEDDEGSFGYKKDIIINMMKALKNTNLPFSSVTSGGDAFSVNDDDFYGCYTDTITGYIQSVLGNIPVNYVWSDHDRTAQNNATEKKMLNKKSHVAFENSNYYVYSLSMGDIGSFDRYDANFNSTDRAAAGFTATVDEAIAGFKAEVAKMDKTRPLLIVSHMPLFDKRNDNAFAEAWYDAISEVAKEMDVFFYYGHNHNHDTGKDYYYAKGSTMNVANETNWNGYQTGSGTSYKRDIGYTQKTNMNFTHLGGGYMEPSSTSYPASQISTTRQGTVLVTVLLQDAEGNEAVHLVTYSSSGEYTGDYALNTVVESVYEKRVTTPDQGGNQGGNSGETPDVNVPVADQNNTGITVAAPGVTAVSVEVKTPASVPAGYTAYASYDINLEGYNQGDVATVTVPAPAGFNANQPVVVLDNGVKIATTNIVDGKITFTTNHFSVYDVAQMDLSDLTWIEIPGGTIYEYTLDTDGVDTSSNYLIVSGSSGTVSALTNSNSTPAGTDITVQDSKITITDQDLNNKISWRFSNGSYGTITNNNQRIYPNNGSLSFATNGATLTISRKNSQYRIYRTDNRQRKFYLRYNEGWTGTRVNFNSSTTYSVYLFKQTGTSQSVGSYVAVDGPAEFSFVAGSKTAVEIQNEIKNAVAVYTATDANGTGVTAATYTLTGTVNSNTIGDYELSIQYGAKELEKITVHIVAKMATDLSVTNPVEVYAGSRLTQQQRGTITATYADGEPEEVPLTLDMLEGDFNVNAPGSYQVAVSYAGITKELTLIVKARQSGIATDNSNPYPEYPHEGAVKVSKTGTGINFQSTGIAQIEVAASGVPIKKGADVIIMLDTSSSMFKNCINGDYNGNATASNHISCHDSRAKVLEASLVNLISAFQTPGEDGEPLDLRVAIADFNGYYGDGSGGKSGTAYDRTSGDYVKNGTSNGSGYSQASQAKVYTGNGELGAGAFVNVANLKDSYTLNYTSGTNYDYAFDAIYQLGTAIKSADRDLFVIFMSDGASLQWNYFGTQNTYTKWNNWLAGTWDADDLTTTNLNSTAHSYFYDLDDHDGDGHINEHRMANAIKGNPEDEFEIIRKSTAGLPNGTLTPAGKDYLYKVNGLGATMFTINFDAQQDGQITVDSIDKALASTASDQTGTTQYYYKVTSAGQLQHAFDAIGAEIAYAATNARFVDQMGANYSLKLGALKDLNGAALDVDNKIEILSYDIYTKAEADAKPEGSSDDDVTNAMIGKRKGTYKVLETITFNGAGTEAYSTLNSTGPNGTIIAGQNILHNGVIYANTFWYNNNPQGVAIAGVSYPTGKDTNNLTTNPTNVLPAETFYWKLGTVQTSELAMRYYVYLEGSMEGTRPSGSYPTNKFATLYYDNYVGQPCYKDTISPMLAWKSANVSYAFYLVNASGAVVVNQTTGATGTFANKIALTTPVVFDENLFLNEADSVVDLDEVIAASVLPEYYKPYDMGASYSVQAKSDGSGHWIIETSYPNGPHTTHVTGYNPAAPDAYTTELTKETTTGVDYTHTTVWFAVQLVTEAHPDTVVVDYGLPVDISVLTNDMFGDYGKLAAVGKEVPMVEVTNENGTTTTKEVTAGTALATGFGSSYNGKYGTATVNGTSGKVRYTLNSMKMDSYDKFAYAVNYNHISNDTNDGFYYDTITVIPATTIYYEDNFLDYSSYTWNYTTNSWAPVEKTDEKWTWNTEDPVTPSGVQGEDRPGQYSLADANNIYGYDGVNLGMSTHSLESAMKATVDYDNKAYASFTFCGTGFDIISMTSNMTGTILVDVEATNGTTTNNKYLIVDTYYGYKQVSGDGNGDGTVAEGEMKWEVDPDANGSIYQVPVIKVADLPYGQYTVTIRACYDEGFDHVAPSQKTGSYDFYLDAIRIYDPANDGKQDNDTVIEDAYIQDGEGWPSYAELRDGLISEGSLGNDDTDIVVKGLVFIDGNANVGDAQISDYISYGPNNEVYLAPGQRVAFKLRLPQNIAKVNIGIKSADGKKGTYTITNISGTTDAESGVTTGKFFHEKTSSIDTATDMYYDLTDWKDNIIVISNTGDRYNTDGIISLTNIKFTYTSDPVTDEAGIFITPKITKMLLRALNAPAVEEVPEETIPNETVPEETKPDPEVIKNELKAAVNAAKKLKEKDYTKDSYKAVKSALKAAEKVLKDKKASQAKIEAALEALNDAIAALEAKPDNSELKEAVKDAKKLKEKDYTKDSYKAVKSALKAAEKVLKDTKASQAEIDEALANLNAAVDGLKTVDVKPIPPKPGASGDNVKNGFKVLESIMNVFRNLLKGNNR